MNGRRLAWIVAVFLVTRLLVLALHTPEFHRGDQLQYDRVARGILEVGFASYLKPGFGIEKGSYYPYFRGDPVLPDGEYNPIFWDPLYPLFLSVIYAVTDGSHAAVLGVQLLLSLLTLLLGVDAVRRMFPERPRVPEIFGWMFVAYLPFAGFVTKLLAETLDTFLLAALFWVIARLPLGLPRTFLAFGALLGLYASIKSYWVSLIPGILGLTAWLLWRCEAARIGRGGQLARLALVLAGAALVLTPTYVRNYNITGGTLLVSTKGSWNLWKDNNNLQLVRHDWRQQYVRVHAWLEAYYELGAAELVPASLERVYYDPSVPVVRPPCDTGLDRLASCERGHAIAYFLEDPLRFARRALAKNANLWSPNNYIFNRAPPGRLAWHQNYRIELPSAVRYLLQLWVILCYLLAMLLFFVGISSPAETAAHRYGRAFAALSLLFLALVVVPWGHGVTRFRLPFMLPVLMFAALGLAHVREVTSREGRPQLGRRRVALVLTLSVLLAAVSLVKLPVLLAP